MCVKVGEVDNMKSEKLWQLPVWSKELAEIRAEDTGIDFRLFMLHYDEKGSARQWELHFSDVMGYRKTSEHFLSSILDAYDTLVEVKGSEWIRKLKYQNRRDFEFWRLKHFAIFLHGCALYEFAARNYEVHELPPVRPKQGDGTHEG